MELEEINLCGPLVSKLIDLETGNEALQSWITLTSLTELEINPVSDLGVFNFRVWQVCAPLDAGCAASW